MKTPGPSTDFQNQEELKKHVFKTLDFYYPACIDHEKGGYINGFLDDGTITDTTTKHLVATSRYIYNFSIGAILGGGDDYLEAARHGIRFLNEHHRDHQHNGYFFEMNGTEVENPAKMAYGHAFVLLASSIAYKAGIEEAKDVMENVYDVLETHFWDEDHGLYRDEWNADWTSLSPYKGQNPNMHLCEAMLSSYEATGNELYLRRAYTLAKMVTIDLAERSCGLVWENYTPEWEPDYTYNKGDTKDEFRPYGFIPGHQFEWAKLLMWLDRHRSEPWMLEKAEDIYERAWELAWDKEYGGLFFAVSPELAVIDRDKNYWVMSEAIAASALLAAKTENQAYWEKYQLLFSYSADNLMDHEHGGWYKLLDRENEKYSQEKSSPPKTDYHLVAACYQAIIALDDPS
ncbi:AGE family epimerase/isomerase [Rossellomorea marisflavi]|uniref:AGE family epimerase/isomerase n=1 Tax=Rossellomorea marisflavi TaxID=189381 RepID=UPI003513A1DA